MSLRLKLVLAIACAALVPMIVAAALPMLQADERAAAELGRQVAAAERQAAMLVSREVDDAQRRLAAAATSLAGDTTTANALVRGPAPVATAALTAVAARHGLERLEVRTAAGTLLATSESSRGTLENITSGAIVALDASAPPAIVASQRIEIAAEPLVLAGAAEVERALTRDLTALTGQPVHVRPNARPRTDAAAGTIVHAIALGPDFTIDVTLPADEASLVRRQLAASYLRLAPAVLGGALVLGLVLAGGIARPIRALAARATAIAEERRGNPLTEPIDDRDELQALTLAFERMLDALAESERHRLAAERVAAWREVARRVAHEVKNPLSPIRLAVQNLQRARERDPAGFDRVLAVETATILEEVESLRRLVDEFSAFASMPAPAPAPTDVGALVEQALAVYAPQLAALGVAVVRQLGVAVQAEVDADQIGRVLKNLLANAIEALTPVTERRLSVALRRVPTPAGEQAEIEVSDSGVGFGPDVARRVFEPYFTTRQGGTGLGLAIVERIVADHGGSVRASGTPGSGATMTVRLPLVARRRVRG